MPFPESPHLGTVPAFLHITPAAASIAAIKEQPATLVSAALPKPFQIGGSEQVFSGLR